MKTVKNYSKVKNDLANALVEIHMLSNFLSYDVNVYLNYDEYNKCGVITYYGEFDVIKPHKNEIFITRVPGNVTESSLEKYYHNDIIDICGVLGLTEDELYRRVRMNLLYYGIDEDNVTYFEDVWNFIKNSDYYYSKLLTHWAIEVDLKERMIEWATDALVTMCDEYNVEFED